MLPGEWSRSFQSSIPPLDSYPSRAVESDEVVLGKRELECPVFITNTVRERHHPRHPHPLSSEARRLDSHTGCKTGRRWPYKQYKRGMGFSRRPFELSGEKVRSHLCFLLSEPWEITQLLWALVFLVHKMMPLTLTVLGG